MWFFPSNQSNQFNPSNPSNQFNQSNQSTTDRPAGSFTLLYLHICNAVDTRCTKNRVQQGMTLVNALNILNILF